MVVCAESRRTAQVARAPERFTQWRDVHRGPHVHRDGPAMSRVASMFTFPNPVNETAVRVTASGVGVMAVLALTLHRPEILVVIAYGFLARVLTGPRLSPLALLSTRGVPRRLRAAPRFAGARGRRSARGLGAAGSIAAVLCYYAFG